MFNESFCNVSIKVEQMLMESFLSFTFSAIIPDGGKLGPLKGPEPEGTWFLRPHRGRRTGPYKPCPTAD